MHDDPVLGALRELRAVDVSADRVKRLRSRCHKGLKMQHPQGRATRNLWRQGAGVAAAAWCALYLFETIRLVAAVYGF
jgi:hypothetical protein